jgi:ATP-dependent DNA helicase RecQ
VLSFLKEAEFAEEIGGAHFSPLTKEPPSLTELAAAAQRYEQKRSQDRARLQSMLRYSESHLCRTRLLLTYFGYGEEAKMACSQCDNCSRARKQRARKVGETAAARLAAHRAAEREADRQEDENDEELDDVARRKLLARAIARRRAKTPSRELKIKRNRGRPPREFDKGDVVRHKTWGEGEVVRIQGDTIGAFFPGIGEKLLKARFLEKVE